MSGPRPGCEHFEDPKTITYGENSAGVCGRRYVRDSDSFQQGATISSQNRIWLVNAVFSGPLLIENCDDIVLENCYFDLQNAKVTGLTITNCRNVRTSGLEMVNVDGAFIAITGGDDIRLEETILKNSTTTGMHVKSGTTNLRLRAFVTNNISTVNNGGSSDISGDLSAALRMEGVTNCLVEDWRADKSQADAFSIHQCSGVEMSNCTIRETGLEANQTGDANARRHAVRIYESQDITLRGSVLDDGWGAGVTVTSRTGTQPQIDSNRRISVFDNHLKNFRALHPGGAREGNGVRFINCIDPVARGNRVEGNNSSGIVCSNYVKNAIIEGNTCYENGENDGDGHGDGIDVSGCDGVSITDNICHDNNRNGINIKQLGGTGYALSDVTVHSNICSYNSNYGIHCQSADGAIRRLHRFVVEGNVLKFNSNLGLSVNGCDGSVTNNLLVNNADQQMSIHTYSRRVWVDGNHFHGGTNQGDTKSLVNLSSSIADETPDNNESTIWFGENFFLGCDPVAENLNEDDLSSGSVAQYGIRSTRRVSVEAMLTRNLTFSDLNVLDLTATGSDTDKDEAGRAFLQSPEHMSARYQSAVSWRRQSRAQRYQDAFIYQAGSYTLLDSDCNRVHSNRGSGGTLNLELPRAGASLDVLFLVQDGTPFEIKVEDGSGNSIVGLDGTGTQYSSGTIGSWLWLKSTGGGVWAAISGGTWGAT